MEFFSAAADSILSGAIEVGVGVVGFTGVIVALASSRVRKDALTLPFQTLLFTAIATVMFAFLPYLALLFDLNDNLLWMICSGVYLLYLPIIMLIRIKQVSKFSVEVPTEYIMVRRVLGGFGFGMLPIGALQILNLFLFQTYWPYLTLVIFYVFFSLSTFAMITLMLWNASEET
jgi:hypothetical protein